MSTWGNTWGSCWGDTWGAVDTASGGGAGPRRRYDVPPSLIDAQRLHMIEADDILLLIAGSIAAGLLQ